MDPAKKARAVKAVQEHGLSLAAAGAQVGVSAMTVKRWVAEAKKQPPALAPLEPPAPVVPPLPPDAPLIDQVRSIIVRVQAAMPAAERLGNMSAVTNALGHLTRLVPVLARLEAREKDDADVMRFSKTEIAEAKATAVANLQAMLARPLHCAGCSRKLSAQWGGLAKDATDRLLSHSEKP